MDHVQSFSALWDKRFPTENSDIAFLCKRCFNTRIYLKHGKGPLRKFLALRGKIFSIGNSDMPFLCIKFFDIRFFLKHRRVPLRKFFSNVRQIFEKISWYIPLLTKRFCETRIFPKHRSVSPRNFSVLWEKKLSTENIEINLLSVSFIERHFFLKERRVAIRNFSGLWDTEFDKKTWKTPLFSYPKLFSIPEVFWNTEGFHNEFFRFCETKTLTKNCDTRASSLIHKIFDTRIFLKHRRVALRFFLVLWNKNLEKKSWKTPSLLIKKNLRNRKIFETPKCLRTIFFGTVEQKNINRE